MLSLPWALGATVQLCTVNKYVASQGPPEWGNRNGRASHSSFRKSRRTPSLAGRDTTLSLPWAPGETNRLLLRRQTLWAQAHKPSPQDEIPCARYPGHQAAPVNCAQ